MYFNAFFSTTRTRPDEVPLAATKNPRTSELFARPLALDFLHLFGVAPFLLAIFHKSLCELLQSSTANTSGLFWHCRSSCAGGHNISRIESTGIRKHTHKAAPS